MIKQDPIEASLLTEAQFALLVEAEAEYRSSAGMTWTDVLYREDTSYLIQPMWIHTESMVEAAMEITDEAEVEREVARRMAKALDVMGYGV